jgi:Flp pilus assembly pilin Flp
VEIDGMNKMILPPDVEFHEDIRLLVWRPHGLLNKAAVNRIITVIGELETTLKEPFNRFTDTVAADAVDLNFEYMIRVSLYRRRFYGKRPPVKSAVLATDATAIHYGRLHALMTQGSPIKVRVFQERKEAAQWLGVPVELLAI